MVTTGGFKTTGEVAASVLVVTVWLFAFTKETYLAETSGECPVESTLHFVDILLAPNTDK